jgi:hypothetical protein
VARTADVNTNSSAKVAKRSYNRRFAPGAYFAWLSFVGSWSAGSGGRQGFFIIIFQV